MADETCVVDWLGWTDEDGIGVQQIALENSDNFKDDGYRTPINLGHGFAQVTGSPVDSEAITPIVGNTSRSRASSFSTIYESANEDLGSDGDESLTRDLQMLDDCEDGPNDFDLDESTMSDLDNSMSSESEDRSATDIEECPADHESEVKDIVRQLPPAITHDLSPQLLNLLVGDAQFNEEDAPADLRLKDSVIALLFRWNSTALQAFFDLSVNEVKFLRGEVSPWHCNLVVARKGNEIRAGYFNYIKTKFEGNIINMYEWDCQVVLKIASSGVWLPEYCTHFAISDSIWGEYDYVSQGRDHRIYGTAQIQAMARQLETSIVVRRKWEADEDCEISMILS